MIHFNANAEGASGVRDALAEQFAKSMDQARWDELTGAAAARRADHARRVDAVVHGVNAGQYHDVCLSLAHSMARATGVLIDIYEALIKEVSELPPLRACRFCNSAAHTFRTASDMDGPGSTSVRCTGVWPSGCGASIEVADLSGNWGVDWAGLPAAVQEWNSP